MNKASGENMATTHPGVLKFFVSKNPFVVGIKLLPVLGIFSYFISTEQGSVLNGIFAFLLGLVFWSLFEYNIHRWVYHVNFKKPRTRWFLEAFHLHHHRNLTDHRVLNAGWFLIYPISFAVWGLAYLISGNLFLACCFSLGTVLYYWFYEFIHFAIHYKTYKKGYLAMIQKYHLYHHHRKWNANYGNTITLWDHLFGTYDKKFKSFVVDDTISKDFVTAQRKA